MQNDNKPPLFIRHIVMDIAGLTLLALGIAKLQVDVEFLPGGLRFPHYGWAFVLLGILMMLPTLVAVYQYAINTTPE